MMTSEAKTAVMPSRDTKSFSRYRDEDEADDYVDDGDAR